MISKWFNIQFAHPVILWLIPAIILLFILWYLFFSHKQEGELNISTNTQYEKTFNIKSWLRKNLSWLRLLTFIFILVALARPQSTSTDEKINTMGIDLVLSMDVSMSMLAQDFKPNRLEAAKNVASEFIENRPNDRVGLVIFSGESFTQVPITTDHKIVQNQLAKITNGFLVDGTAIGDGIGTAVNRLKDSQAKSKVIILMTDGDNNSGVISPEDATALAETYGIKIYTIGVGSNFEASLPVKDENGQTQILKIPVTLNEPLLTQIAKNTGGQYFRATDNKSLEKIYKEIDQLEKTKIETSQTIQYAELFYPFALLAILSLFIEQLLKYTWLKSWA